MAITILLVEDEEAIRSMLRFSLEKNGYSVLDAENASDARELLLTNRPEVIIVDWMMPEESGIEFIKKLKCNSTLADIPTMMLTARVEESDKVRGLDSGADDYMTKPVALKEFHSRIKALLRRASSVNSEQTISCWGIEVNLESQVLVLDGVLTKVGQTEFNLIKFFMSHKNKVYSRSQLLDYVWGQGIFLEERTVDVHMLRLRKLLKSHNKDHYFVTIRGMGYMFTDGRV